jgi:hypothetical protein
MVEPALALWVDELTMCTDWRAPSFGGSLPTVTTPSAELLRYAGGRAVARRPEAAT